MLRQRYSKGLVQVAQVVRQREDEPKLLCRFEVKIRKDVERHYVQITVRDTGQGIKPEFLPYVFDRYQQAGTPGGRRAGGLGLGLSLTRQRVEMHGGSVAAESEGEGKRATFTVKLPVLLT